MAKEPETKPEGKAENKAESRPETKPARPAAPKAASAASASKKDRRDFVAVVGSIATGTLALGASVGAGVATLLDPLLRKKAKPGFYAPAADAKENYVAITTLEAVPDDGLPRRFPVMADRVDAWTFSPGQPIGAVYVRREPGEQKVTVFHSTCPHAGCSVSFKKEENGDQVFFCPCHNSAFDATGVKRDIPGRENPSPRDLDTLNVDEEKLAKGEIWVEYVDFYTGQHEKKQKI